MTKAARTARRRRSKRPAVQRNGELMALRGDSLFGLRVLAHSVMTVVLSFSTSHAYAIWKTGPDRTGGAVVYFGHLLFLTLWVVVGVLLLLRRLHAEWRRRGG